MRMWIVITTVFATSVASAGIFDKIGEVFGFKSELTRNHTPEQTYQRITVDQLKKILTSKEEWSGVYHLQQLAFAFNEYDNELSASFTLNDDGSLEYSFVRAARSNGEIDDGSCNGGSPLPRRLEIKMSEDKKTSRFDTFEGYLFAHECKNGVVGDTKEIWVPRIQISTTNHLVMTALILPAVETSYHLD